MTILNSLVGADETYWICKLTQNANQRRGTRALEFFETNLERLVLEKKTTINRCGTKTFAVAGGNLRILNLPITQTSDAGPGKSCRTSNSFELLRIGSPKITNLLAWAESREDPQPATVDSCRLRRSRMAGLVHLEGLTQLESFYYPGGTEDQRKEGLAKLQKALPEIARPMCR